MTESKRVVVTGLGCVSPLGNTVAETWEKGSQGQSGIDRIEKFDPSEMRCQIAGEVRNFELPDLVPPKEAKKMDLFIHYAIAATQEALQDAALEITEPLEEEVGISMGVGIGGLGCIEKYTKILLEQGPKRVNPFFIPMTLSNLAPGQVSMLFRARNYSACSVSACASSNHAIGTAMRHIERGDAKVMISGGAESSVTPLGIAGFAAMHALSTRNEEPQKASRPYDTGRDGFVMGEGAGMLILEEYEFAKRVTMPTLVSFRHWKDLVSTSVEHYLAPDVYHSILSPRNACALRTFWPVVVRLEIARATHQVQSVQGSG